VNGYFEAELQSQTETSFLFSWREIYRKLRRGQDAATSRDGLGASVVRQWEVVRSRGRWVQVKPYYLDPVMEALKPHITERHLIISIVAGVKLAWLENNLPGARLVHPVPHIFTTALFSVIQFTV
jgi:pyrroline-5-carboxylate reductase